MKNLIVVFLVCFLVSCGTANKAEAQSEIKVAEAFHQGWTAGVRGGGGGINFNLMLKSELPKGIELKRVIFKGFEVPFIQQDTLSYNAAIITGVNQERFEGDEKSTSSSPKNNTKLKDNEAILIYSKNGKEYQQKITNVVEKPALEYPSARPKF
jgi:hypothetical protein